MFFSLHAYIKKLIFIIFRICLDFPVHDRPMEEEKVVDNNQAQSSPPVPAGLPINWGLITGPVQPVLPSPSLGTQLPPPQSSAVHALQTKVKSLTQRRTRGRDREKERFDAEVLVSGPAGISSEVFLRQRPRGKGQLSLPSSSWRSGAARILSSSDEEEEVEVQVRLEIHSPPADAKGEQVFQEVEETEGESSERNYGQPCGLGEGTSLESLLSDNSSSSKDDPSPPFPHPPPLPVLSSSSPATTSAATTSSNSSSTSTRHWAPPKGFWRVARPETLLLNGVGPNNIPPTVPLKDYTQTEALAGPQRKPKPAETGTRSDVGTAVDECDESSLFKYSDSVESFLERCEQKETDGKGMCSSDSWESVSSQTGPLSADERLKVKQRAYAKLRERQQNCREERDQSGEESGGYHEDTTDRVDCKGRSLEGDG